VSIIAFPFGYRRAHLTLHPHFSHFMHRTSRPGPPGDMVTTSPPGKSGLPVQVCSSAIPGFI
jgi:hypothetical protein